MNTDTDFLSPRQPVGYAALLADKPRPGSRFRCRLALFTGGVLLTLLTLLPSQVWAQTAGDYRSKATGIWSTTSTWERYDGSTWVAAVATPTSADGVITVRSPDVVTITANLSIDQTTIDSGAQVTVNSGVTLTIASTTAGTDLAVNGTLLNQGSWMANASWSANTTWAVGALGTYIHNTTSGGIATPLANATLDPLSTLIYRGSSTLNTTVAFAGRTFGNLSFESTSGTWTPLAITGTTATRINGDFTIGANVNITGMTYTGVLTIGGNFTQNGTLSFSTGTQNFTFTGVGKTIGGAATTIGFETWNVNSGASITLGRNVAVASGFTATISGTLNCGANNVTGAGTFILSSGATLGIGSAAGILSSGASGNIQTTTRNFNSSANYTYNGSAAQDTGLFTTTPTANTVNNLTIANTGGAVSLSDNVIASSTAIQIGAHLKLAGNTLGGAVAVQTGGTLSGNATASGAVAVNGTIAPGESVGQLDTGPQTWAPGGTYVWEIEYPGSEPGIDWDYLNISGNLTITATNKSSEQFTIKLVSLDPLTPGIPGPLSTFLYSLPYAWTIATASGSVVGYNSNKFILDDSQFATDNNLDGGHFSLVISNTSLVLVFTPRGDCTTVTTATSQLIGSDPNKQMEMTFTNASGLSSVQSLVMDNCTVSGIAYNIGGGSLGTVGPLSLVARTTLPVNTVQVVLLATKVNNANPATVNVIAIDTCGRGKSFDPVITTLKITAGNQVQQRFEGLLAAEHYLRVVNATPGLRSLDVNLNGRNFHLDLADGQDVSAALGGAMLEGLRNVVILTGIGEVGSSALVLITDTPTGNEIPLSESVRLTLTHTAAGLMLAWPETLTGWQLQSSATANGDWSNVTSTPAAADGQLTLAVPTTGSAQFYRLHPATTAGRPAASGNPTEAGTTLPGTTQPITLTHSYDALLW